MPLRAFVALTLFISLALSGATTHTADAVAAPVVPINWSLFTAGNPTDANSVRARDILLNANKFGLQTWYPAKYGSQSAQYVTLGGTDEQSIRQPANEAAALAISLRTGAYDPIKTGVTTAAAKTATIRLLTSVAKAHLSNTAGGWGNAWQSALWAYMSGYAGWLMWGDLSTTDRIYVANMVDYEANRFLNYTVPYYRNNAGTIVIPGDSKAEENGWNAQVLTLATAMMPSSPNWNGWMAKNLELMISANSVPSDTTNQTVINGKTFDAWLNGSNIDADGTVMNHNRIHPDYMASSAQQNSSAPLAYSLAGMATPKAALFNAKIIFDAMVNKNFATPPYNAPGGFIYRKVAGVPDASIYFPQGNDWGTGRRMHFALLDAQAQAFGYDTFSGTSGTSWETPHATAVAQMQARFTTGQTYGASSEDTYVGREPWVAFMAAETYMTHWLVHQGPVTFTNQSYPSSAPGLVSDLVVNDAANAADWSSQTNLQSGNIQYGDRSYTLSSVPASLVGSAWIRTAADSKAYTGATLVTFKVSAGATVYVAHHDAITTKPTWMSTWTDSGLNIDGGGSPMSLYEKTFAADATVSLGPNGSTTTGTYTVLVTSP